MLEGEAPREAGEVAERVKRSAGFGDGHGLWPL